ncbi:hypothetical protein GLW08_06935 [Pontibacillus yanchengensis]|uniref:Uncharacterized protein n=2 Tax=Pontibacillus yanchengensis TaxID=462910 RepID=A0ACC7VE53_9BACI|nr:gluconate 2-dehydrogenase subunit 3 family protein [Pontibacillus yanchengensis]MYL32491.1 hypothetical protein [Pontibacillus yanchengensis]MYL53072.1 hypothetical protein [Pontibacillus yanchengensis]
MTKQNHPSKTYYPTYDVISQKNEWDEATQSVIFERVHSKEGNVLSATHKRTLQALSKCLFPSHLGEHTLSISMVLDQRITNKKLSTFPREARFTKEDIIIQGLENTEQESIHQYHLPFFQLDKNDQLSIMEAWKEIDGDPRIWNPIKSHLFHSTLTSELIKIIYADPHIWSTIGFAGPAYPRGYYAFGPHQFDEWEAKPHDENLL